MDRRPKVAIPLAQRDTSADIARQQGVSLPPPNPLLPCLASQVQSSFLSALASSWRPSPFLAPATSLLLASSCCSAMSKQRCVLHPPNPPLPCLASSGPIFLSLRPRFLSAPFSAVSAPRARYLAPCSSHLPVRSSPLLQHREANKKSHIESRRETAARDSLRLESA